MPDDLVRRLAENVKAFRVARGWTTYRLAKEAGLSTTYIDKVERGDAQRPSYDSLSRIADAVGVSVEQLVGEQEGTALSSARAAALSVGRSFAPILANMKLEDPIGFLRQFSNLPAADQELIADMVHMLTRRTNRKLPTQLERPDETSSPVR